MSAEEQNTVVDAPTPTPAAAAKEGKEVILGEDGKPLSKGELKKRAKEAESEYEQDEHHPPPNPLRMAARSGG